MLGSAFLGAIIALYLPFFRQLIWGPKLKLFFGKEIEGSIAKTPIELNYTVENIPVKSRTEGYYIRVMVKNIKYTLARDCRAFLANIEKKKDDNNYYPTIYNESIQLQWACRSGQGFQGIDLAMGINQFIDVISTLKDKDYIEPKIDTLPFRYRDLFNETGIFRYTIQVCGNEVRPVSIKIIFHWHGNWDNFDAYIDPESHSSDANWCCKLFN